jgi:hypothetical protein
LTKFVQYIVYRGFVHQQHLLFGKGKSVLSLHLAKTNFTPEQVDVEVCFPDYSSFHLGGEVYLRAEREEITLKQGAI